MEIVSASSPRTAGISRFCMFMILMTEREE